MASRRQSDDQAPPPRGSNVTDLARKEFWKRALKDQQEIDKAEEILKAAKDMLRDTLKVAKGQGLDPTAIKTALKARLRDRDELAAEQREIVRMMAISGVWPTIQTDLFAGVITEAAAAHETTVDVAYDQGHTAGVKGENRTVNGYVPGTEQYDAWDRGWLTGQSGNVERLVPADQKARGRPKKAVSAPPADEGESDAALFGDE